MSDATLVDSFNPNSEERVNSTDHSTQFHANVTALQDDGYLIGWTSAHDDISYDIYAQRFAADGTKTGTEFQVNQTTADTQIYPDATTLNDGSFVVSWQSNGQDGSGWGVYGRVYDANGQPQGSDFLISEITSGQQTMVDLAGLPNGGFVATWQTPDTSGEGISQRLFYGDSGQCRQRHH
jgi:hypothetical protein